jgi:hypothetical protein
MKLRDLFLRNQKKREKRLKELHKAVRENFSDQSRRSYVIALAGDRKVTWKPGFIKSGMSAFKAEMRFECYDIKTGSPVSTTVWWTYNGSKSKGDVKGSSGTSFFTGKSKLGAARQATLSSSTTNELYSRRLAETEAARPAGDANRAVTIYPPYLTCVQFVTLFLRLVRRTASSGKTILISPVTLPLRHSS